ncbi:hypothetical protein [Deinococcus sp.]|uniref:hypothetical protein n=1 Tax=Deinococcus sp. TaxID=47478 RepID=UPI003CC5C38E
MGDPSEQVRQLRSLIVGRQVLVIGHGIQGSHTDFLICACSAAWSVPILTRDQDYLRYAEHVAVRLSAP